MSSFEEQASLQKLRDLLMRFLDTEEKQEKIPVFSAFMKDDGRRAQIQGYIHFLKSPEEKPMQTLKRVFAGQIHFGPFTGADGTIYPDRISMCGGSDIDGSSVVYPRFGNRVPSQRPCRFGSHCNKEGCTFVHPPKLKGSAASHAFPDSVLFRAEGALTYILDAEKEPGMPFQVAFAELLKNTAFEKAVNLGRPLDERTLLDLILALRLGFSPSTGIISLPSVKVANASDGKACY
jgi:hypothetical protein